MPGPIDSITPELETMPPPVAVNPSVDPGAELLDRVRSLVLKAHPDVVPELISGDSIDDLMKSITPARDAYASLVAGLTPPTVPPPVVPAGATGRPPIDSDLLPPSEKLRRGLAARHRGQ